MVPLRLLVASVALFVTLPAWGKVLTDWQTGCQIVVPNEWRTSLTAAEFPGFGARSYNTKDLTSVDFNVDDAITQAPVTEKTKSVQDLLGMFKDTSVITNQSPRKLNGVDFLVLSASPKPGTNTNRVTAWFTVVKGHACRIILSVKGQDPDKSDVLNGIIQSFVITDHVLPHSPVLDAQGQQHELLKNNPLNFYGIVLDQAGKPVAGAKVVMLVQGELGSKQGSTEHDLESDQDGRFKMEGVHSFGVIVTVSKDGYLTLPDKHHGPWFWIIRDGTMPTKDEPAVFPLQKKGVSEPLVVLKSGSVNVPTDGTILGFNLERCRVIEGQPGTFNVQLWVDAHDPKASQPFHWKFRITVPGGGLQPRTSEYAFSAPIPGYQESMETEVAPGAPGWSDSRDEDYFIKQADGNYAQVRLTIRALGDFFITQGYLNSSGSQNLDFDPAKRVKP